MSRRLVLLDSHALLFRAYHAMPAFTTPDGRPSGAVYGFTNVILRVLRELEPAWVVACFDAPGPTFRDERYPAYKATRPETPPEIIEQEAMVKEVLDAMAIPHEAVSGFEADDLIATLVEQALSKQDIDEVVIVTGDRDLLQLTGSKVKIYLLRRSIKDIELLDKGDVEKLLGLPAAQYLDWKALRGDPSDNIPGVPGIGEKTAMVLIEEFGTLEELYRALEDRRSKMEDRVSEKIRERLLVNREQAFLSRELIELKDDAPVTLDLAAAARTNYRPEQAAQILKQFGFKGIVGRLPGGGSGNQLDLFGPPDRSQGK